MPHSRVDYPPTGKNTRKTNLRHQSSHGSWSLNGIIGNKIGKIKIATPAIRFAASHSQHQLRQEQIEHFLWRNLIPRLGRGAGRKRTKNGTRQTGREVQSANSCIFTSTSIIFSNPLLSLEADFDMTYFVPFVVMLLLGCSVLVHSHRDRDKQPGKLWQEAGQTRRGKVGQMGLGARLTHCTRLPMPRMPMAGGQQR